MHKATLQGQRAAFVGREHGCSRTKAVCAVPDKSCLGQIQARSAALTFSPTLAAVLPSGITQLFLQ